MVPGKHHEIPHRVDLWSASLGGDSAGQTARTGGTDSPMGRAGRAKCHGPALAVLTFSQCWRVVCGRWCRSSLCRVFQ
jgi:hypothetical protein